MSHQKKLFIMWMKNNFFFCCNLRRWLTDGVAILMLILSYVSQIFCYDIFRLQAFNALISNALRVAAINSVGDFILFLGKCAIAAITGFVGLLAMKVSINGFSLSYDLKDFLDAYFSYILQKVLFRWFSSNRAPRAQTCNSKKNSFCKLLDCSKDHT